jgi:hypothetical protein
MLRDSQVFSQNLDWRLCGKWIMQEKNGSGKEIMRNLKVWISGVWLALASGVYAQSTPVVVELFTSQGCMSCPPADSFLTELARRDDVIALALHVDYWDYIGWKDKFASREFTKRQKAYAHAGGRRMIYTPQMIIGGVDDVVVSDKAAINRMIQARRQMAKTIEISVVPGDGTYRIEVTNISSPVRSMAVQLVRFYHGESIDIERGENAGQRITYSNVVTKWELLGAWDGQSPLTLNADVEAGENAVLLIQKAPYGAILAASVLR